MKKVENNTCKEQVQRAASIWDAAHGYAAEGALNKIKSVEMVARRYAAHGRQYDGELEGIDPRDVARVARFIAERLES